MSTNEWINRSHNEIAPLAQEAADEYQTRLTTEIVDSFDQAHGIPDADRVLYRAAYLWHFTEHLSKLLRKTAEGWVEDFYRELKRREEGQ